MKIKWLGTPRDRVANDTVGLVAFLDHFLSPTECQKVVEMAEACAESAGIVGDDLLFNEGKPGSVRDSRIRFIEPDADSEWLFSRLQDALLEFNKNYQFDLHGFFEGAQVASYETGGHYTWHKDVGVGTHSMRKLSVSVQLSAPADYDGGELEFFEATREPAPRDQGLLIIFPSFLVHRVAPVTRGVRRSMVSWISGPPFR